MTKFELIEWIKDRIPTDAKVYITADYEHKYDDEARTDMMFFRGVSESAKPLDKVGVRKQ